MRIRSITASDTHELRLLILRNGDPSAVVAWPGDLAVGSFHLGAFIDDRCITIASFVPERHEMLSGRDPYRLRGMASRRDYRRRGAGSKLLENALARLRREQADLLWCNAREAALAFYLRNGFLAKGGPFEIEGIGVHHLMYLPL